LEISLVFTSFCIKMDVTIYDEIGQLTERAGKFYCCDNRLYTIPQKNPNDNARKLTPSDVIVHAIKLHRRLPLVSVKRKSMRMHQSKLLVLTLLLVLAACHVGGSKKSENVATQENEKEFRRGKYEVWEGEGDEELSPSQEAGMIPPTVIWEKKKNRLQVPFVIDKRSKFLNKNLKEIKKAMSAVRKTLKIGFKMRKYETYHLMISSLKSCTTNMANKKSPKFNELRVCFGASKDFRSEILRAATIGLRVHEKIKQYFESDEEEEE
jgi:hypothetical protein